MSTLTTCLYGELDEVAELLGSGQVEGPAALTMAVTNVCRKVRDLQKRIDELESLEAEREAEHVRP